MRLRWKAQQVDKKTRRFITSTLRQILGWSNNVDRRWEKHVARTRWEANATFQTEKVRGSETWLRLAGLYRRRVSEFVKSLTREDLGSVLVVRRHLTLPHPPFLHRGTRNCSAIHQTNWNSNFRPFPVNHKIYRAVAISFFPVPERKLKTFSYFSKRHHYTQLTSRSLMAVCRRVNSVDYRLQGHRLIWQLSVLTSCLLVHCTNIAH